MPTRAATPPPGDSQALGRELSAEDASYHNKSEAATDPDDGDRRRSEPVSAPEHAAAARTLRDRHWQHIATTVAARPRTGGTGTAIMLTPDDLGIPVEQRELTCTNAQMLDLGLEHRAQHSVTLQREKGRAPTGGMRADPGHARACFMR